MLGIAVERVTVPPAAGRFVDEALACRKRRPVHADADLAVGARPDDHAAWLRLVPPVHRPWPGLALLLHGQDLSLREVADLAGHPEPATVPSRATRVGD